ncbi:MAG: acylneuraminate cytidylyltransferase family protein [Clostridia bacterium]|nr:acylneuraminate cytidylyltransferase family protein [Clostridia bacterium]
MKIACFIPIKSNSERVPGKNFRILCNRPLYQYIIDHAIEADCFDTIFVDTNSEDVKKYCEKVGAKWIEREAELAKNTANGNDLLNYHYEKFPEFDYYFQLFATAPFLQPASISNAVRTLTESTEYDSTFTALSQHGFYWYANVPVNYRPAILPRSQDMLPVIEETTGLYGISNASLKKYRCRIGSKPYVCVVNKFEAIDINTEDDLKMAEFVGEIYWKYSK